MCLFVLRDVGSDALMGTHQPMGLLVCMVKWPGGPCRHDQREAVPRFDDDLFI